MQERSDVDSYSELRESLLNAGEALRQGARTLHQTLGKQGQPFASSRFDALEEQLFAHMQMEEELLLPVYELVSAHDAARIRSEHSSLRAKLRELRAVLTVDGAEELMELLSDHVHHEEEKLYPWADACLTTRAKRALLQRVERRERLLCGE